MWRMTCGPASATCWRSAARSSRVLAQIESGEPYDQSLWRTLAAEMGLAGMAVPERFGGGGASLREAAVVLEELGRGVAPVPFLSSAVVATDRRCSRAHAADPVTKLAAGESVAVLAVPLRHRAAAAPLPSVVGGRRSAHGHRHRRRRRPRRRRCCVVPAARRSVPCGRDRRGRHADAGRLARPDPAAGRHPVRRRRPASGSPTAPAAAAAVAAGLTAGAALLASEQLGLAEWCLDTTVEYVKVRHQFARPVGSFQALKHRLADMWVDLTQARAVARYAAVVRRRRRRRPAGRGRLAQAFCSPVAVKAAEECVQLHGGIGFTWEHPAHLFLKRAKADAIAFGTADRHRQASGASPGGPSVCERERAPSPRREPMRRGPYDRRTSRLRVDGRAARAQRTRRAMVDALLALIAEGDLLASPERIVERAGVSLRTLWTNFKDLEGLYAAVDQRLSSSCARRTRRSRRTWRCPERIRAFCEQRGRLLELAAPATRAIAAAAAVLGPAAP